METGGFVRPGEAWLNRKCLLAILENHYPSNIVPDYVILSDSSFLQGPSEHFSGTVLFLVLHLTQMCRNLYLLVFWRPSQGELWRTDASGWWRQMSLVFCNTGVFSLCFFFVNMQLHINFVNIKLRWLVFLTACIFVQYTRALLNPFSVAHLVYATLTTVML